MFHVVLHPFADVCAWNAQCVDTLSEFRSAAVGCHDQTLEFAAGPCASLCSVRVSFPLPCSTCGGTHHLCDPLGYSAPFKQACQLFHAVCIFQHLERIFWKLENGTHKCVKNTSFGQKLLDLSPFADL
jgi:hypothetical protein